jgi:hypothetical protein
VTTWFAQNSSVNIDSTNQWNSAANGSGSWLTWASLGASDVLVANGKTSITINVNVTCATLTTEANGGTAGGGFLMSAGVVVTANVIAGSTTCISRSAAGASSTLVGNVSPSTTASVYTVSVTGGSLIITGNITAGSASGQRSGVTVANAVLSVTGNLTGGASSQAYCINASNSTVTVTGTVTQGTGSVNGNYAINANASTIVVNGDVYGGTGSGTTIGTKSYGVYAVGGTTTINGNLYPSTDSPAVGQNGSGTLVLNGELKSAANGMTPFCTFGPVVVHATSTIVHTYRVTALTADRSLYTGGVNLNQPAIANVRSGTTYGAASEYTGTLAVPSPTLVAIGVATDNTVGSYAPTGGLDAAGVRSAIGLASANLDIQLSGLQSDTNDIQTRLPAALVGGKMDSIAELDSAVQTQIDNVENASGYILAVLAGACADPQTASETYAITVFGSTFTVDMAGQTSTGTRTAPTLTKT